MINIGFSQLLVDVVVCGVLLNGLVLDQMVFQCLLCGECGVGILVLENLIFSVCDVVNIYGSVSFDIYDLVIGKFSLVNLVLGILVIYGYGIGEDVVSICIVSLVWSGFSQLVVVLVVGGVGSGSGILWVDVECIILGYGVNIQLVGEIDEVCLVLGFVEV